MFVKSDLDFDVHFAEILQGSSWSSLKSQFKQIKLRVPKKNRNQIHQNANEIQTEGFQTSHMQLPSVLDNLPKDSRLTGWKGKEPAA